MGEVIAVASAVAQVFGGLQANKAARAEARQYEENAALARAQAAQQEAERRRELDRVLATQEAIRSTRQVELVSGTSMAIRDETIAAAEDDIQTIRLNAASLEARYSLGAESARAKGMSGLLTGLGGAARSVSRSVYGVATEPEPGPKKKGVE